MYKYVDLGTKEGNALQCLFDDHSREGFSGAKKNECVGVDLQKQYKHKVQMKGFNFLEADVCSSQFVWYDAICYSAFDFLEHLPSIDEARWIVKQMLSHSSEAVWVRAPSFEQNMLGEGGLRKHGLRFAWTNWVGHPAHVLVKHVTKVMEDHMADWTIKVRELKLIPNSHHKNVVPISAPIDTVEYEESLGEREFVEFDPQIVGMHDILAIRK